MYYCRDKVTSGGNRIMNLSIIIPAFNEEKNLPITLKSLERNRFWNEIIVVDDGSYDQTASTSLPEGVCLIQHKRNYGKGSALQTGIEKSSGDLLLFLDADLGETAHFATSLLPPVVSGQADITIAKFPPAGNTGGFGLAKKIARLGIKRFTGVDITEPLSGQRCMHRKVLNSVSRFHLGFGIEVAITLDVLRAGYKINEVEIPFIHRTLGKTWAGFIHRGNECREIIRTLWYKRND